MAEQGNIKTPEILEISKYELTLAEFPTFTLAKGSLYLQKARERVFEDTISGKNGEPVRRIWTVIPHESLGFGTPSTHSTLFELMQIWKEQGFASQYINFKSIFHLLKRMGKGTGNSQYKQIEKDLEVLVGIIIKAQNAFWDNDRKGYVDAIFHLFDSVGLYKETPEGKVILEYGFIKASDFLFHNSILKSSILSLPFDNNFFHRLTPVEQRLVLYLSKVFRSQTINKRRIIELGRQLPLEAKEKKYIKRQLKINCDGLMKKGFSLLAGYDFKKGADCEYIVFKRKGTPPKPIFPILENRQQFLPLPGTINDGPEHLAETIMEFCGDKKSLNYYKKIARIVPKNIIFRALSEAKVADQMSETIKNKAAHFTFLVKKYAKEQGISL
ncbi:MAG: hypothetical protein AB1424_13625 [Thermodesulfobacteriota bacterium]